MALAESIEAEGMAVKCLKNYYAARMMSPRASISSDPQHPETPAQNRNIDVIYLC